MFNAQEKLDSLSLSLSLSLLISLLINFLFPLYSFSQSNTTETLTITTYYPSPYGVYKELRLYPNTSPTTCDSLTEGNMYYNSDTDEVRVCKGIGGSYNWQSMSGLWTLSGTNLYPNDPAWKVGIGTTSPAEKLHVVGNIYTPNSLKAGNLAVLNSAFGAWGVNGLVGMGYDNGFAAGIGQNAFGETGVGISSPGPTPAGAFYINPTVSELRLKAYNGRSFNFLTSAGVAPEYTRLYIANSGNVGIGTTSPSEKLHVNGNTHTAGIVKSGDLVAANNYISIFDASGVSGFVAGFPGYTSVGIGRAATGEPGLGLIVGGAPVGSYYYSPSGNVIVVQSYGGRDVVLNPEGNLRINAGGWIERMRVTSSGNVGIGTTWPLAKLEVVGGDIKIGSWGNFILDGSNRWITHTPDDGRTQLYLAPWIGSDWAWGNSFEFLNTGIAWSNGWSTRSDQRLKEKVEELVGVTGRLKNIRGVTFYWKTQEFPGLAEGKQIGMIAQEVEREFPELVSTDTDGYKAVDYGKLTPVLIEALKEQQREIDGLKARIEALEAKPR